MELTFDLFLSGELETGVTKETVAAALAQQFSIKTETALRLLDGKRHRIKSNCNKDEALRYRQALAKIGAKIVIARRDDQTATAPLDTSAGGEPRHAPLGSLLVTPSESIDVTVVVPDLSIADTGEIIPTLQNNFPPVNPNTSHLRLEPMTPTSETHKS